MVTVTDATAFHGWLRRHKIIFETVAVASFTIATIFVSWLQWRTSEKQAEISRRQIQPNFLVSDHQLKKEGESSFEDEERQGQQCGGTIGEGARRVPDCCRVSTRRPTSSPAR